MINPPVDKIDTKNPPELSILNHTFQQMSVSRLRKAFVDSGLGEGIVGDGPDTELR